MRAFLSGRIDLMQAEAVLGVIDANGPQQLTTALSQLAGGISSQMLTLREQLLLHLADLEAGLDFVEEDIDFVSRPDLVQRLQDAEQVLSHLWTQASQRMVSSGHHPVVLAGLPNAGKSTLVNALLGQEVALVSPVAGTTRDFVRGTMTLRDLTIDLLDTAGWEEPVQELHTLIESQRQQQLQQAELILWCTSGAMSPQESVLNDQLLEALKPLNIPVLRVITKSDLPGPGVPEQISDVVISARTGAGLDQLRKHLYEQLVSSSEAWSELVGTTAVRCQQSLLQALQAATRARLLAEAQAGDELIACELREVLNHLGVILGSVYTDDILDRIFSRFCIGK
jgi:tRNA modification GTPase